MVVVVVCSSVVVVPNELILDPPRLRPNPTARWHDVLMQQLCCSVGSIVAVLDVVCFSVVLQDDRSYPILRDVF